MAGEFEQALGAGVLGGNLLAIPNTLEDQYQQAQRNRALLESPDIGQTLGVPPQLLAQAFPTQPSGLASMAHSALQVPVLGQILKGIGGVGQILQMVTGSGGGGPAPRPPLEQLKDIAALRRTRLQEEQGQERVDLQREGLRNQERRTDIEERRADAYIRKTTLGGPGGKTPPSYVVGSGEGGDATGAGSGTAPTGVQGEGHVPSPAEYAQLQKDYAGAVKRGEITQDKANAELFAFKNRMQGGQAPTSGATPPTSGSSTRYGHDFFHQKVAPAVALQFGILGLNPENFSPEDLQKAEQAARKSAVETKVAETRGTAGFKSSQEVQKQLGSIRITRAELSDAKEKIAALLTSNPLIARSTQPIEVALKAALQSTDPEVRDQAVAARQLMLWAPQLAKAHGLTARFNQTEFNMYATAIDPTKMTALEFVASIDNMLRALDVAEQEANRVGGGTTTPTPGAAPQTSQDWHSFLDQAGVPR